jgi:histidinol-phosphate/aromatic aminotransferase/cobyric acid decarboxylase-like protein
LDSRSAAQEGIPSLVLKSLTKVHGLGGARVDLAIAILFNSLVAKLVPNTNVYTNRLGLLSALVNEASFLQWATVNVEMHS